MLNGDNSEKDGEVKKLKPTMPIVGLVLHALVPVALYIGIYVIGGFIGDFSLLYILIAPVVAVIMGIVGICKYDEYGKLGLAFSIADVATPVVVIAVCLLLMSNGIMIIRFM